MVILLSGLRSLGCRHLGLQRCRVGKKVKKTLLFWSIFLSAEMNPPPPTRIDRQVAMMAPLIGPRVFTLPWWLSRRHTWCTSVAVAAVMIRSTDPGRCRAKEKKKKKENQQRWVESCFIRLPINGIKFLDLLFTGFGVRLQFYSSLFEFILGFFF